MENENKGKEAAVEASKPKKKTKLPLIIGVVAGAVAVIVVSGIIVWPIISEKFLISSRERRKIERVIFEIDSLEPIGIYSLERIQEADEDYQNLSEKCQWWVRNADAIATAYAEYDLACADDVIELIDDLSPVTIDSFEDISTAAAKYDSLTLDQQALVTNYDELTAAYDDYDQACADVVIDTIANLSPVTTESYDAIVAAEADYDDLTSNQQVLVTNYADITASYEAYDQACADEVSEIIDDIGTVNGDSLDAIDTANESYEALTENQQALVNEPERITEAYDEYYEIKVQECISLIDAITESGDITLDSREIIFSANAAYRAIPANYRDQVTNHDVLANALHVYGDMAEAEETREMTLNVGDTVDGSPVRFTLTRANVTERLLPNDTSGYYRYYHSDGNVFIDLVFEVTNTEDYTYGLSDFVENYELQYGEDRYRYVDVNTYYSHGSTIEEVYPRMGLAALDSTTLHVAVRISDDALTNGLPIRVTITIGGEEYYVFVRS